MPHNTEANNDSNTEELAEGSRSILLSIASQLTKGTDLHRVTLPTFVLETRSMLERITDFMAHPELILPVSAIEDPIERFIGVVKWYLSGWHIKPSGVKKPYNPVLGEFFRCKYDFEDGAQGYYIAEQVSHHPPASAFFYSCPKHDVIICGDLKPKSRFYGNSVASLMKGTTNFIIPGRNNERYEIHMPNMYARGVLFGTMTLELGDASTIKCVTSDLVCELDFQTKGFFSGQWNSVTGKIKRESTQEILYELSGQWSSELYIKKYTGKSTSGGLLTLRHSNSHVSKEKPELLVDVRNHAKYPLKVPDHQEGKESRNLWNKVTESIRTRNLDGATDEKLRIEDSERAVRKEREEKKIQWNSRFFDTSGEYCVLKDMDKINYKNTDAACKALDALYPQD